MMKKTNSFFTQVCNLAVPVTLQSMLQSSFSIVDQIMIGQLGSICVAGVGLAAKFASILSVVVSAVGAVAGILLSQYLGQKNRSAFRRSFFVNLFLAGAISVVFMMGSILFSESLMGIYTTDPLVRQEAGQYLLILAGGFPAMAGAVLLSTLFRCLEQAKIPLYASVLSAVWNTLLNYLFIFGAGVVKPLGSAGAALATVIAQWTNLCLMLCMLLKKKEWRKKEKAAERGERSSFSWRQYLIMLWPVLVCETAWSLGENVYAAIYAHMGTRASAAMTLLNPVQGLMTGALCGLSQAAAVLIGKRLGSRDYEKAYRESKHLLLYGTVGALVLSAVVFFSRFFYVQIYQVEEATKHLTSQLLITYALVAPLKVLNMILGGGILRSGGKTSYSMAIDLIGTWGLGVPLGLLAAFWFGLSLPYVYLILSMEEGVRLLLSLLIFRKKSWMQTLEVSNGSHDE